ncbi:hypothetical protein L6452_25664 [Arctium lappa]|uniref:Uncharacterized protein n=1 Tax=Arctium lappa TaxID=4217 RepID=A0ACB9ACC2_ARCLA|nr:hypothetical protein L6452_25664 [Arctium lappa]
MKDLTMEDTVNNNSQGKSKDRETIELMKEPVIEIGSSSTRCTRSATRSKEVKEETQRNHTQMEKHILSCGKSKDKYEGCSAQGSQAGKKVKGEETDEMEKKRKTNTSDSTDSLRKRSNVEAVVVNDIMLLYVESTISKKVEVEKGKPASSVWNIRRLRKRETTELEDGGFGLLPIKPSYQVKRTFLKGECSQGPRSLRKDLGKQVPGDETVTKFKTDLENMFGTAERTTKKSKEDAVDEEKGKSTPMAIVVYDQVDEAKEFDACSECPQFVSSVTEKVDLEVQKS